MRLPHVRCLSLLTVVALAGGAPLNLDAERGPLAAVSELNSRLVSRAGLLPAGTDRDQRLALPSPQDLETIKKVAQILVMLGEQVLPSIFGERPSRPWETQPPQEVPADTVKE